MGAHQGGCMCGSFRYATNGYPAVAAICHCRYCQLRTGSAFGTFVYFLENNFDLISGSLKKFNFISESGKKWETNFCSQCGTTVTFRLEVRPGMIGVSGGTFDPPPFWYNLSGEVFTRSKAHFLSTIEASVSHSTYEYYNPIKDDADYKCGDCKV